jgi:hypothetical protein
MTQVDDVRQRYRRFANSWYRDYSAAYYDLALAAANDHETLQFLARQLQGLQPNLFFAALQYLTGVRNMPASGREVRTLVRRRGDEIARLMRERCNQTNETTRCALILPALPSGPLALIEVGASAGLCLLMDRFGYDYEGMCRVGTGAPVYLPCTVTGRIRVPPAVPEVVWRRGVDLRPIDVNDGDAVRWLDACVWSDHEARRSRLHRALEIARGHPQIVAQGDLVANLPALVADAPADAQLVVFHSATLTYVNPGRRVAFVELLARLSCRRPIVLISNEVQGVMGPPVGSAATVVPPVRFLLHRRTFVGGVLERCELLALTHPHGLEMTWFLAD